MSTTARQVDTITRLVTARATSRQGVLARLQAALRRQWRAALRRGGTQLLYRDAQVWGLAGEMAVLVRASQRQAALARALGHRSQQQALGLDPAVFDVQIPDDLRGMPLDLVYGRPAETFRWAQSRDLDEAVALALAEDRLDVMADLDLQLAEREATRQVMEQSDSAVIGYRRIIRPEMSLSGTCGLCIAASDRVYSRSELLPIHARCKCLTSEVIAGGPDPGNFINRADLDRLYAAAGGASGSTTSGAALKRVRARVEQHGELGPVLVDVRHAWRGPEDVARDYASSGQGRRTDLTPRAQARASAGRDLPATTTETNAAYQAYLARLRASWAASRPSLAS